MAADDKPVRDPVTGERTIVGEVAELKEGVGKLTAGFIQFIQELEPTITGIAEAGKKLETRIEDLENRVRELENK